MNNFANNVDYVPKRKRINPAFKEEFQQLLSDIHALRVEAKRHLVEARTEYEQGQQDTHLYWMTMLNSIIDNHEVIITADLLDRIERGDVV